MNPIPQNSAEKIAEQNPDEEEPSNDETLRSIASMVQKFVMDLEKVTYDVMLIQKEFEKLTEAEQASVDEGMATTKEEITLENAEESGFAIVTNSKGETVIIDKPEAYPIDPIEICIRCGLEDCENVSHQPKKK